MIDEKKLKEKRRKDAYQYGFEEGYAEALYEKGRKDGRAAALKK